MGDEQHTESKGRRRARRLLGVVGVFALFAAGVVAGYAVWERWGTGIATEREQNELEAQFEAQLAEPSSSTVATAAPTTTFDTAADNTVVTTGPSPSTTAVLEELASEPLTESDELLAEGSEGASDAAIARLEIPKIGERWYVVSGVTDEALGRGPGHYTSTPGPGEPGNFAIAGHRTGYGAPFYDIDELEPGDEILITTPEGVRFTYRVTWTEIVEPEDNWVIATTDTTIRELTLTSCHPRNSTKQRIIVRAEIVDA